MKLLLPFHLHKVGAGFPSPATDYVEDDIDLNAHLIKNLIPHLMINLEKNLFWLIEKKVLKLLLNLKKFRRI